MCELHSNPSVEKAKRPRHSRTTAVDKVAAFEATGARPGSQRGFAREHHLPRTTLQYWLARKNTLDADPALIAFFESPAGLAFLHRQVTALHFVFTQAGPCGIRLVSQFLELSGLDPFVATSYGAQQEVSRQMTEGLIAFGKTERDRLAASMTPKQITVAEDETFHPEICLVAIEPVSNFLLVEKYAAQRDAETWTKVMTEATKGLPVEIIQSASDEAKGILAHAGNDLGAHHSPDLFHGQHELCKATSLPLASSVKKAATALAEAGKETLRLEQKRAERRDHPAPGRPPGFDKRIAAAKAAETAAAEQLAAADARREQTQAAIRGLGEDYHPFDPSDGRPLTAREVEKRMTARFTEIGEAAEAAGLPVASRQRIAKARRLLAGFVATIAFYHFRVGQWIGELRLSPELKQVVLRELIPGLYLERAAGKLPLAADRARVRAVAEALLARARDPAGALSRLPPEERARIEAVARAAADLFQRSSSCVEGRNGQLSLRHHSLHRLSGKKLAGLTVVHNYHVRRADGTTAAERFFGAKPADLFAWLVDHVDIPARPAAKRSKAA